MPTISPPPPPPQWLIRRASRRAFRCRREGRTEVVLRRQISVCHGHTRDRVRVRTAPLFRDCHTHYTEVYWLFWFAIPLAYHLFLARNVTFAQPMFRFHASPEPPPPQASSSLFFLCERAMPLEKGLAILPQISLDIASLWRKRRYPYYSFLTRISPVVVSFSLFFFFGV